MAIWHDRIREALEGSGENWAALAKACGISTAGVAGWSTGKTKDISGERLVRAAKFLRVSEAWLLGLSPVQRSVSNMALVTDKTQDEDVLIPQHQEFFAAAGSGSVNDADAGVPTDYVTFKGSWLKRKGLRAESLVVIYASGDSMADRVRDGDVVLIDTSNTEIADGGVYAFVYSDTARLKRLRLRVNGNVSLISDNDSSGDLREDVSRDTLDQLHIVGRAVWVGGDLR